jgi:uncharacterized protein
MRKRALSAVLPFFISACGDAPYDPRGVDHGETLLSVSATGRAESRPDEAQFQAGIESWAKSAKEAGAANLLTVEKIITALKEQGVPEKDIQTRTVNVQRIGWGDKKGQYQASNIVAVTVRNIEKAGAAVTAVTDAGANIVSGPNLRMSDPEKATNTAYGAAYSAARTRAEAYAAAAGMEIARVLTIRDGGGSQGNMYIPGAPPPPVAPYPVSTYQTAAMPEEGGRIMPGQTTSAVTVQVDFALVPQ